MADHLSVTPKMAQILKVFLEDVEQPRYGFELMQLTSQHSGTLYPILATLEKAGWLNSHREDIDPKEAGRRPRRMYLLTPDGAVLAQARLEALAEAYRPPVNARLRPQGGTA
ncbi:helix-turn-helix transcriptional regulator [Microbispora cellulosiformans]|uniref:Helix-turn-helix transcriptional regulator n=1 Tax=Microbispora cellulosiformans TaxID=2614688 RepID=A0A5J5K543_9ACTN|nr:PadR family transcriptional regulator [Microbispora cellulosiformans]KAA9379626.1 helix-turn-helix transcriptional regulator [Microbispora cellulosiformans]